MILLITGDHPRHQYLVKHLSENCQISGWIIEERDNFVPEVETPDLISREIKDLFKIHFQGRYESELKFFGDEFLGDASKLCKNLKIPYFKCNIDTLNSKDTIDFIKKINPELVFSYGCHVIKDPLLSLLPEKSFNLHGGISPWYKGCITHFWPSYHLEPQMTGMTLHRLTNRLDGGDVLHQNTGVLHRGDGIHDLACRTVKEFIKELPFVVKKIISKKYELFPQKNIGKLWLSKDWNPEHLKVIYKLYENKVVDYCLDNIDISVKKKIIRCKF